MNEALENLDAVHLDAYTISVYSYEEMKKIAGDIEITESKIDSVRISANGGINDARMGTLSLIDKCTTCTGQNCPGHLGIINFGKGNEIINPLFIRTVLKILNCVCHSCSRLLFSNVLPTNDEDKDLMPAELKKILKKTPDQENRLTFLEKYCRLLKDCCSNCDAELHNVKKCGPHIKLKVSSIKDDGIIQYENENKDKKKKKELKIITLHTPVIHSILRNISKEHAEYLGFIGDTHPVDLIMQGMFVIPPLARPPITDKNGESIQNPITMLYLEIVKAVYNGNNTPGKIYKAVRSLCIKNDNSKKGGQEIKSIKELMQGKNGIYRSATMGKRGDWCARSVAGPGHHLSHGQIELPMEWSTVLSKPLKVTNYNQVAFQKLLETGRINYIKTEKGFRQFVDPNNKPMLMIGQEVEILLKPGDRVISNRQPSLHKGSMQGFEIVLGQHQVIKNHLSTTSPFNLDFDGDEINVWVPQDLLVEAETEYILNTKNCIISTSTGRASMGLVMNSVTAGHLLSLPDVTVTEAIYLDMLGCLTNKEALPSLNERLSRYGYDLYTINMEGEKLFSGRAAISALFPSDFYYTHKGVTIYDGILIDGVLNKSHLGPSGRSIVQELVKHYSIYRASDFLTDAPHLLNIYIVNRGFTVGINDCVNMVVDSKTELYNTKYNKKVKVFQDVYDELADIVYSPKSYNNIESLTQKINRLIDDVLETSVDLSFNKNLNKFKEILTNIPTTCVGVERDTLSSLFKDFFQEKIALKNKLINYLKTAESMINLKGPITESLNIKLKMIIHAIELGFILSGDRKDLTVLLDILNKIPLASDKDSINQAITNIFDNMKGKGKDNILPILSRFKKALKNYHDAGVPNIQFYREFHDILFLIKKSKYDKIIVDKFIDDISKTSLKIYMKKYHLGITEESEEITQLYKSLTQLNTSYQYVLENFIKSTSKTRCFIESASLAIFNEVLLLIQGLMYQNLKNTLGQAYNKNYTTKKEEIAKVILDLESLGSKQGLPYEEQVFMENIIMEKVNIAKAIGSNLAKTAPKTNAIIRQTEEGAGTKGSSMNIGQIKGAVGQQYVSGQRLWHQYPRLSSHYDKDDENPVARGLIESSFYEGLTSTEMFFILASGRENVIETFMSTPSVGQLQRFLERALENVIIAYDGSVRNSNGFMYSPSYNAGFDISKVLSVGSVDKPTLSNFIDLNKIIDEQNHLRGWFRRSEIKKTNIKIPKKKFSLEKIYTDVLEEEYTAPVIAIESKYNNVSEKLTLYEKARLLGSRAKMLNSNDRPRVEIGEEYDPLKIAKLEFDQGKLAEHPALFVIRTMPDGSKVHIYPTINNII